MVRYLRLYLSFLRFSLSKAMEFRLDFYFRIFMDLIFYAVNLGVIEVLYQHTSILGGWDLAQARVFMCSFFVVDALYMTIFSNNVWWLPFLINRGDLDYYLVRPVSPLFFLLFREFSMNSFINLLLALAIWIWSLMGVSEAFTVTKLLVLIALMCNGLFLYCLTNVLFTIPVIWTQSGRGLNTLFFSLGRFMEKPDRIFKGALRVVLTTVLPLCMIASMPTRLFVEKFDWQVFWQIVVVSSLFYLVFAGVWKFALRSYSSASS